MTAEDIKKADEQLPPRELKAKPAFAPTRPKDVFGSLPYKGTGKVDRGYGMRAIAAEAKRRHARNRY